MKALTFKASVTRFIPLSIIAGLGLAVSLSVMAEEGGEESFVSKFKSLFGSSEAEVKLEAGVGAEVNAAITAAFANSRPGLKIESISESEFSGLFEVQFASGPVVYASADGQYFIAGELYENTASGIESVAERKLMPLRAELLAKVKPEDMIIFSPEGETKGAIYVFTDVDCGYCQKLHREVPTLNAQGIEVRYLAFPRAGKNSPTYNKMVTAWCADDRRQAMNTLKSRNTLKIDTCSPNPVEQQYQLGSTIGVTGTPAIVTENGKLIPGYRPAAQLVPLAMAK